MNRMFPRYAYVLACALIAFSSLPAYGKDCLIIASSPDNAGAMSNLEPLVLRVFKNARLCFQYEKLPVKRLEKEMREGRIDAEFPRGVAYILSMKGEVIRVPTPLVQVNGVIVTLKSSGFKPSSFSEIQEEIIGHMHGVIWQDSFVRQIKNTHRSKNYEALARMLKAGRIDGFLADSLSLHILLKDGYLTKQQIHRSFPIVDISGYLLVNKRHSGLIPALDQSLRDLRSKP